ncbi:MAG TPA: TolC family protein [Gemmatimonadaceae bacterium]|nr:TolC family protein [Gemmatimonadaceae bacterium]
MWWYVVLSTILITGQAIPRRSLAQDSTSAVSSAPAAPLTVKRSVELALAHNVRLAGARAATLAARAGQREARASLLPALRSSAGYTRLGGELPTGDVTLPGIDGTFPLLPLERDRYQVALTLEQPLFAGGRLRGGARAAASTADAAAQLEKQEQVDVAFDVRRAYWTLHAARRTLAVMQAAVKRVEAHLTVMRQRFEAGTVLRSDLLAAEARRSEIELARVDARNAARLAEVELNRLTGQPLLARVELAPEAGSDSGRDAFDVDTANVDTSNAGVPNADTMNVDASNIDTSGADASAKAAALPPEIRALGAQIAAERARLSAERGGWFPSVSLLSRYVYARPSPYAIVDQTSFLGTWEAGVSIDWNLWDGGAREARVEQATARVRSAEARLEEAKRLAEVEVTRQSLEVERAAEAMRAAADNVARSAEALRVTEQQFREGVVLSAQLLDAEQTLLEAEERQVRAVADSAIARAALMHATGRVW